MSVAFQMSRLDWLKLTFLSLLWGVSFIFMEIAIEELGTFTITFSRVVIATLALNCIIALQGHNLWHYKGFAGSFFIMAFIGIVVPFSLIVWGQIYITASLSSILNGTLPFFTLVVAHFFTHDEKISIWRVVALVIGFVGVIIIIDPNSLLSQGSSLVILGQVAVLAATLCYAVVIVYGRRFSGFDVPHLVPVTAQMTIASLILLPLMLWEAPWQSSFPSYQVIGSLLGIGLLSTALAFTLWYHLLSRIGSNNLSLVTFMIPVSAITIGYVFLGEKLTLHQMIGMAIVVLGLTLMDKRLRKYPFSFLKQLSK